ncbi:LysR family transcriptional regulator [Levilactobacillus brevis]|jgi:DNA-binding transcriptional LysR family regulator|nr:LysR family transcriptional regulator [Levilactobacillus brevis]
MTIDDFYSFITLYKTRNISDAAIALNITQSALSKRLRNMQ